MTRLIKKFADGSVLEFDRGRFDAWCVYLTRPGGIRRPPLDTDYFSTMRMFGRKYGERGIYDDFVSVYDRTNGSLDPAVLDHITEVAGRYDADRNDFDITLTTIYGGMIAEELKAFAKLGKRIKRLGIHQVLLEGFEPSVAATFSKGKKWRELDAICLSKGF